MSARTIVVGDVHGCLDELRDLLKLVSYQQGTDRLVLLGDLVDRGPDPAGVVRVARELGAESVMGNHDEKCVRWFKREADRRLKGKENKMRPPAPDRLAQWEQLSLADLEWMSGLPLWLDLGGGAYAVHAGWEPALPLEKQTDKVLRIRYCDAGSGLWSKTQWAEDDAQPSGEPTPGPLKGAIQWPYFDPLRWKAPRHTFFGHAVHSLHSAVIYKSDVVSNLISVGMDSGACFGGSLTAAVLHEDRSRPMEVCGVKARAAYAVLKKDLRDN